MAKPLSSLISTGLVLLAVMTGTPACTQSPRADSTAADQGQLPQTSPWEEVGQLPTPLESHKMLVLGDFVYSLGGWNETKGIHEDVFVAPFTPADTLDDWQETTAPLPLKLQHHEVFTHDSAIYVLGGDNGFWDGSQVSDRILRAVPTATGDITEWVDVGRLPAPLTTHAIALLEDQVYVFGGSQTFRPDNVTVLDTIYRATLAPDGTISAFEELSPFPTPIGWLTTTVLDRRIFAVSGNTQFRPAQLVESVWVADVGADQSLAPFRQIGTTVPRRRHTTVLVDRTLVVIGGGGARGVLSSVTAADIDDQGNLSPWRELPPLPETLYAHAAFVEDGYIYVSGGFLRYGSNDTSRRILRLPISELAATE